MSTAMTQGFMEAWCGLTAASLAADPDDAELSRHIAWNSHRDFQQKEAHQYLHDLLEVCRAVRAAAQAKPLTPGELTDLESCLADFAEAAIAVTPVGELWRVVMLLASEAAGNTVVTGL
jgi:hypothetical protein